MKLWLTLCGAATFALLSGGAAAQEDVEAVYAKLHAATLTGNSDAVIAFATAKQKADLASKSKAEKDGVIMLMSKMLPRTYKITEKNVAADGSTAVLRGSGIGEFMGKSEMYLNANFVKEGGAWKVDQWGWTSDKPAGAAKAAAAPPAKLAAPKPAPVEKTASAPAPRPAAKPTPVAPAPAAASPGVAPPPCVYKAVMTADDLKACGIAR